MDIKNHRVNTNAVLLPNQKRLVAAIKEAAHSGSPVFKPIDGLEGRAFLRDCCKSVDTKMSGVTKDLPAFKALRYCINEYSPYVYSRLKDKLEFILSELDFAVGADIPPPLTPGTLTRATMVSVIYSLGELSDVCTLEDAYLYMGFGDNDAVERSNKRLGELVKENYFAVKAIKPSHQVVIDYFDQLLSKIAMTEGMYFLVSPTGELNEPSIQLMLAVPTDYGQCMRKLCLSFHNDYAELVNKSPAPENVAPLKKQY